MDVFLEILAALSLVAGIIGCVLPIVPGPPLAWLGLLLLNFTDKVEFEGSFLFWTGAVAVAITILDNFIPVWGTKRFGGTRWGVRGSTIGLIAGLFFAPVGIILGPFLGALIAEMIHDSSDFQKALKSAMGSLIGFLLGVGLKLIISIYFLSIYIGEVF